MERHALKYMVTHKWRNDRIKKMKNASEQSKKAIWASGMIATIHNYKMILNSYAAFDNSKNQQQKLKVRSDNRMIAKFKRHLNLDVRI